MRRYMRRCGDGSWRAGVFLLLCVLFLLPTPLTAKEILPLTVSGEGAFDEKAAEHRVEATLLVLPPDVEATSDRFRVGVALAPDEHWHVYWKNSGDAGLSTQITWTLTQAENTTTFTQMSWPAPQVFVQGQGAITTYGYAGEVLHEAIVPDAFWERFDPAREVEVVARLNYLTCEVECIPGQHELSLTYLPARADAGWRGERLEKFDTYGAMVPVDAASDPGVEVSSQRSQSALRVGDEGVWRVALRLTGANRFAELEDPSHLLLAELVEGVKLEVREVTISEDRQEAVVDVGWRVTASKASRDPVRFVAVFRVMEDERARAFSVSEVWEEGILQQAASVEQVALTPLSASGVSAAGQVDASRAGQPGGAGNGVEGVQEEEPVSFIHALWLALLGGLLLNIMPCVFPVLSIKLAGIAQVAHHNRREMLRHGLAYAAGVVSAMAGLALAVIALKVLGVEAGWGFQFQSPTFLLVLIGVLTLFAVNLFGAFEFGTPMGGQMQEALSEQRSPWRQSFLEGLLCVALATPCSAPFMGTAIGFALASSWSVILTIFVMLGVGLALPFVALCALPAWTRFLPKPGPWLEKLKYVLGWCVLVTCVWLLWLLGQGGGVNAMAVALGWMCVLAALGAVYGLVQYRAGRGAVALKVFVLVGVIGSFLGARKITSSQTSEQVASVESSEQEGGRWKAFDEEAIAADVAAGKTVFVDFTADWCITCKVNERGVLESEQVLDFARTHGVVWYKADWTHRDDRIRAILKEYGKGGVPMYLIYGKNYTDRGLLLSELLTEQMVIRGLEKAMK